MRKKIKSTVIFIVFLFLFQTLGLFAQDLKLVNDPAFESVNSVMNEAKSLDAKTLSPNNYKKAIDYYEEASIVFKKRGFTGKVRNSLSRCKEYLDKSVESAKIAKLIVGDLLKSRNLIISKKLYESAEGEFRKADNQFYKILEEIESGNLKSAKSRLDKAENAYLETAVAAYQKGKISEIEVNLKSKKKELGKTRYKASKFNLDNFEDWLKKQKRSQVSVTDFVLEAENRIKDVSGFLVPLWYANMPDTLNFGEFTLYVEKYTDKGSYDISSNTSTGASGTAKIRFHCGNFFLLPPYPFLNMQMQTFTVVETVTNPDLEILISEAQLVYPEIRPGKDLTLSLPEQTIDRIGISAAKKELLESLKIKPIIPGIRVEFSDATIAPGDRITIGSILEGFAVYPTEYPDPEPPIKLYIDGFQVEIDSLTILPTGAIAEAFLKLHKTIIDEETLDAARINLGSISITQDCQFYKAMSDSTFGPWVIDPTGMSIEGVGLIADFNKAYSPTGYGLDPDWRGVVLANGHTIPAESGTIYSNSGYLNASYLFNDAKITGTGIETKFDLEQPYIFFSVVPYNYEIQINDAFILVDSSAVQSGQISSGTFLTPKPAVCTGTPGTRINGLFSFLDIQKDLDIVGKVILTQDLYWGELSQGGKEEVFFQASPNSTSDGYAWFYLNGRPNKRYIPSSDTEFDNIHFWGDIASKLETNQLAGLTVMRIKELRIFTPDLPGNKKELHFIDGYECSLGSCWLNIEALGLSGEIQINTDSRYEELGDTTFSYYKSDIPFYTELSCIRQKERCFYLHFASSALYDSEFHGDIHLPLPCNTKIPFVDLEFTSSAHIVGGDIDLSEGPVELEYWDLELVETSPGDPAGALSVKTGQIILTQAGISEPRHFAQPFHLIWGELLADGNVGELFFDYNSAGQEFDGFLFTPHYVALSKFEPSKIAYLQVCGDNHFDFFGSIYLSIQDSVYTGDDDHGYYAGRRIGVMKEEQEGCSTSEMTVVKDWGSSASNIMFDLVYDDNDQDGFLGEGVVALPEQFYNPVPASIQLDSEDIEIGLIGSTGENFQLHAVDIGSASEIWGCLNIEGNTLECITLGFTLESYADSPFGLLGSAQSMIEAKMSIKPTVVTFVAAGSMYLDMSLGGNVMINGSITLIANRDEASVFGDFQGEFDFGNICSGFEADGHLNWYLSPVTQYIQGRGGIKVYGKNIGSGGLSGGVFIGNNVPKDDVWVLTDTSNRYAVNMTSLPDYITGVYGFGQVSFSMDFGVFGGGLEIYAGVGAFVNMPGLGDNVTGLPLPYVLANIGVSLHGEILWGAVSASAWVNLQLMLGSPFYFQGSAGLEGCVLWVMCASVDVTVRLDEDGFDIY